MRSDPSGKIGLEGRSHLSSLKASVSVAFMKEFVTIFLIFLPLLCLCREASDRSIRILEAKVGRKAEVNSEQQGHAEEGK